MTSLLRIISSLIFTTLIGTTASCAGDVQSGRDFTVIDQPLTVPKDKIEVVEFFSYACPHCKEFHPALDAWAAKLPKDVTLRRVPVTFNRPPWARLSRLYFTLEAMGELPRLNGAVFTSLHDERYVMNSDESVVEWAVKKGLDKNKFNALFTSFSIQSLPSRADQEAATARIQGVPSLVVDGKYLLNNEAAGNYPGLLSAADKLIIKARTERRKKSK
ncbi:MAG: thiol:disulfide interchange protein DsbA/DsbL [Rhodocyclales bacterium]|jgi:thiol:disulfide interchange protein DsbA|nr:thiol:disulfide interchange protein DsbA/DsbL [Rhodocyclales bacterium]MBH1975601.1 thiol:disulfide interchange protein DsbA/DsbL [Rhodocyclales bacterium]MBT9460469.1 thiol:disulfide interchange protein DsbA/DsbL [Rugosibacter sp.]